MRRFLKVFVILAVLAAAEYEAAGRNLAAPEGQALLRLPDLDVPLAVTGLLVSHGPALDETATIPLVGRLRLDIRILGWRLRLLAEHGERRFAPTWVADAADRSAIPAPRHVLDAPPLPDGDPWPLPVLTFELPF